MSHTRAAPGLKDRLLSKAFELRGWIKWIVYSLLLINFGYYLWEEWVIAGHTLTENSTLLAWGSAFAATLEELGWFLLLVLFELETATLPDEAFTPAIERSLHIGRVVAVLMLAHSVYAYVQYTVDLERKVTVLPGVSSLCELADQEAVFASNMRYTTIDSQNCVELSDADELYQLIEVGVVTDPRGLTIEKQLGWYDVIEILTWILIILTIEIEVWLQNRDVVGGPLMRAANTAKLLLYGTLFLVMGAWALLSQWLYVWDEFVWIAGFFVIEMNVVEWRDELIEELTEEAA